MYVGVDGPREARTHQDRKKASREFVPAGKEMNRVRAPNPNKAVMIAPRVRLIDRAARPALQSVDVHCPSATRQALNHVRVSKGSALLSCTLSRGCSNGVPYHSSDPHQRAARAENHITPHRHHRFIFDQGSRAKHVYCCMPLSLASGNVHDRTATQCASSPVCP